MWGLKEEKNKNITIVGAQPADGARIPGIRKWSPDYVPKFFDRSRVDIVIDVTEGKAEGIDPLKPWQPFSF